MSAANEASAAQGCAAVIGAWLLGWPSGAVKAAVAMKGWEWFVTDTFGVHQVGLIEAWGLMVLISLATAHLSHSGEDKVKENPLGVMLSVFITSLALSGFVFLSLLVLVNLR